MANGDNYDLQLDTTPRAPGTDGSQPPRTTRSSPLCSWRTPPTPAMPASQQPSTPRWQVPGQNLSPGRSLFPPVPKGMSMVINQRHMRVGRETLIWQRRKRKGMSLQICTTIFIKGLCLKKQRRVLHFGWISTIYGPHNTVTGWVAGAQSPR